MVQRVCPPRYLPICCSLCLFLFSPSWISSQMVPQPQCQARNWTQLPAGFPQSWPPRKPGANWSCEQEWQAALPLQSEPAAAGASSAGTWGGKERKQMYELAFHLRSVFYVLGKQPELYIKINILIKITFLLDPESSSRGEYSRSLKNCIVSLCIWKVLRFWRASTKNCICIYTHCALHRVNIYRIREFLWWSYHKITYQLEQEGFIREIEELSHHY